MEKPLAGMGTRLLIYIWLSTVLMINTRGLILDRYKRAIKGGGIAGEGVSGVVIKAEDTLGIYGDVAIKRPNPMLSFVERRKKSNLIKREGEALKRMNHDSICRFLDEGEWPNSRDHCLVIDWAKGQPVEETLRTLESEGGLMPRGEALDILVRLADVLTHAHESGVVHNDLDAKHLFWEINGDAPSLMVIDWANCAFSSDARPIATVEDDLKQYGELMHRLLTGSSLAYATRLGGEDNWQIELADKDISEPLQEVVARAVGKETLRSPYTDIRSLRDDLARIKAKLDEPHRVSVTQVEELLEENSTPSLQEAEALISQVAAWNPNLVKDQREILHQLRRERAENMARIGGRASLLAEQWEAAQQEIEAVFGRKISQMSRPDERYIFLFGKLMTTLEPNSEQYQLGKKAIQAIFEPQTRNEDVALDNLLLLHSDKISDNDPLIQELSRQTDRRYPIRNRIRQVLS